MRSTYLRYKWSRVKAFFIREKVDFRKQVSNYEFARFLSACLAGAFFVIVVIRRLEGSESYNYFAAGFVLFAAYIFLSVVKDYRKGDDVAWDRKRVRDKARKERQERLYGH